MEFKEYGPLAQSKEMATNKKTSWVLPVIMLGLGVIAGIAYVQLTQPNMVYGVKRKEQQNS